MDNEEPQSKRIKLSLEPTVDKAPTDINDQGVEIYQDDPSLPEKLMERVDRIWFERGDWKNITEESLKASIQNNDENDGEANDTINDIQSVAPAAQQQQQQQQQQPGFDIVKVRDSVVNKLFHAKSEIDVALDVINILLAQNRPGVLAKDAVLPLPAGSLHATYVAKPKPTSKAQLESAQLTLGLKRKQQRTASEFLRSSAKNLKKLVEVEQTFWDEALDLRRNNWLMQANTAPSTMGGLSVSNAGTSFLVRYGYTDVGSDFSEVSFGEFSRTESEDENTDTQTQLNLPHNVQRRLVANVRKCHMERLARQFELSFEVIMGMSEKDEEGETKNEPIPSLSLDTLQSKIQQQLVEAQATIFDAELYSAVLSEAQSLANTNDVHFADEEIIVNVDGHVDLAIQRVHKPNNSDGDDTIKTTTTTKSTTQQMAGRTLDLALRLLLIQRHRYNMWKSRARLLCPSRKTQQLLASIGESVTYQNTSTGHGGSTSGGGTGSAPSSSGSGAGGRGGRLQVHHHNSQAGLASAVSPGSRKLPPVVPILSNALSMCKFWVLFDRVRQLVYDVIEPFSGEGGMDLAVHYEMISEGERRQNATVCEAYPSVGGMSITLSIAIKKGQFLLFELHHSGNITVRLPQGLVTLGNISEFQALLIREINLICLRMVCDAANDIVRNSPSYKAATTSEQARLSWKVDDIEEMINGSLWWALDSSSEKTHVWRSIQVQLIKTKVDSTKPAYQLQFQLLPPPKNQPPLPTITREILLARNYTEGCRGEGALTFSERVKMMVDDLVREAAVAQKK
ncbi:subunit 17 of mediator complex-domain-containing protein [Phascolomyces articulosus]|uniref:Mediator of RNA polymerase II transcription subunit 17 n=1 Tax=Phascolomyces articulosus TaxID=60185 RepID=A0AAD5JY80_9FUNG|nr:subunit 17 of mediator complex-domain-containing protein [Phascolomyces articulosus]